MATDPTGLQMQYTGITFVYGAGPTTLAIDQVEDVNENFMGETRRWSADDAPGPVAATAVNNIREATLVGGNVKKFYDVPLNTVGTLTYILGDFYNGEGPGAITVTMSRAKCMGTSRGGPHNTVQRSNCRFEAVWKKVSGVWVDPVAVTQEPAA